ncbi:MAG: hypothetical protein KAH20_11365 [Methylococcales bacterium]|nr:hypothetical protein [Methylococcales bacterium]
MLSIKGVVPCFNEGQKNLETDAKNGAMTKLLFSSADYSIMYKYRKT